MPRTPDQTLKNRRRREILRAATRCFVRYGFHLTTMDQICVAARLSPGAVYRYFRSKHAIIESIADAELMVVATLIEPLSESDDFVGDFIQIVERLTLSPVGMEDARLSIEIMAEAQRNPRVCRVLERHGANVKDALERSVERARTLGQIDSSLAPAPLAELLLALVEGMIGRALFNPRYDRRALIQSFRILATRFLRPSIKIARNRRVAGRAPD